MRTTLDLPDDVAQILRLESAKRGGRKRASLSKLVTDAVRMVYLSENGSREPEIRMEPGRVVVQKTTGAPMVNREDVLRYLWDEE